MPEYCKTNDENKNEDENVNKVNIYTPGELNNILINKIQTVADKFGNIQITGDIANVKKFKNNIGMCFSIINDNEIFNCKLWKNGGFDIASTINKFENENCLVTGVLKTEFFNGHRINLIVNKINLNDSITKLQLLKNKCAEKNIFSSKKNIIWSKVNTIGIISKIDTQGYNDFTKQFKFPLNIILKEIQLEGSETSSQCIEAIKDFQDKVDIVIIIRGGGSTIDISNSFDKIELFDSIKKSDVPVVTAIGHKEDRGDKLLITDVSDFDFATPSTASYEITNDISKYINVKINAYLSKINSAFNNVFKNKKTYIHNNLNFELNKIIKGIFDAPIFKVDSGQQFVIFQIEGKFYKQKINLKSEINLTEKHISNKNVLEKAMANNDIHIIDNIYKDIIIDSKIDSKIDDDVCKNIDSYISSARDLNKAFNNFNNDTPNKILKYYCKCDFDIDNFTIDELTMLKNTYLYYKLCINDLDDLNSVHDIYNFFK